MRKRTWNHRQRLLAIALACAIILFNIVTTVTVAPPIHPSNSATIYLCDDGMHSSLLLPVGPNRYVEYLYGDWDWAVTKRHGPTDAMHALFLSNQATLGVQYITQWSNQSMPVIPDQIISETAIVVDGDLCRRVEAELAARWQADRAGDGRVAQTQDGFACVKDSQHYSWLHDCNLLTADCLAEMGCEIRGYAVWSRFNILSAGEPKSKGSAR